MSSVDRIAAHYRLVFALPSPAGILFAIFILSVLFPYALYSLWTSRLQIALTSTALTFTSAVFSATLTYLAFANSRVLSFRRSLGLSFGGVLAGFLTTLAGFLVGIISGDQSFIQAGLVAALPACYFLRVVPICCLLETPVWKASSTSLTQPLLWSLMLPCVTNVGSLLLIALLSLTTAHLLAHTFLKLLERSPSGTLPVDGLGATRAFVSAWLGDDVKALEDILGHEADSVDARICVVSFRGCEDDKIAASLVIPWLHPGPIRNLGSSQLTSRLSRELAAVTTSPVIVLHSAVTHSLDLTSSEELETIALAARDGIGDTTQYLSDKWSFAGITEPGSNVCCVRIADWMCVSISMAPYQCEDLYPELAAQISQASATTGVRDTWVVDAHNCYDGPRPPPNLRSNILERTTLLLRHLTETRNVDIYASSQPISAEGVEEQELCGMGGHLFLAKFGDFSVGFVVFDTNNIMLALNEEIAATLRKEGLDYVEVLTSDTHERTGFSLGRGYVPLGTNSNPDQIIENVTTALHHSRKLLRKCTMHMHTIEGRHVSILGDKGLGRLAGVMDRMVPYAKSVLPIMALATVTVTMLLVWLLLQAHPL